MEKRIKALLLKFPGTNCEKETAFALEQVGFSTKIILWKEVEEGNDFKDMLGDMSLFVLPGGFSYGDFDSAGKLAADLLSDFFKEELLNFVKRGGYILGICNGFQILCQIGLLPGAFKKNKDENFICRWVKLINENAKNVFLAKLPSNFELPIACSEGRYYSNKIKKSQIGLTYNSNYLGGEERIAGVSDETGNVFGIMPHPERFIYGSQHPDPNWSESYKNCDLEKGWGFNFFASIYEKIKNQND